MIRQLLDTFGRTTVGLLAGAYLVYLPFAGWSFEPLILVTAQIGLLAWYRWGEISLPRRPLPEQYAAVVDAVDKLAALAGRPMREAAVVVAEAGDFTAPEALSRAGVIVFSTGDLEANGLSHQVAQASRQIATAEAPPEYSWPGLLATGAVLGALLAVRAADPSSLWRGAVAAGGLFGLVAAVVAITTGRSELRGRRIEDRARVIMGLARDKHPELFADLTARQGLGGDPSLIRLSDTPLRACDHGAQPEA